jgi:hypothetical protein
MANQAKFFAQAKTEREVSTQEMHLENSITRMQTAEVANPPIDAFMALSTRARITVPAVPNCKTVPIFGSLTSCSIIKGTANETSPQTGDKKYMNMIPPAYRPAGLGGRDRLLLDHNRAKQYLSYNSVEFPHFCGQSATFSMWIENWDDGARSTLISRYVNGTSKRNKGAWFYQIDADPSGGTKCCIGQIPAEDKVAFWKCAVLAPSLNKMRPNTRRHLALVLNKDDDTIKFYIDGVLAETKTSQEPPSEAWIRDTHGGGVGRLDCLMNTPYAYTGLGHRVPGESPYMGPVQDWRYYVGHALTHAEIKSIAQVSQDEAGSMLRKCTLPEEGKDSNWRDIYGNDCTFRVDASWTRTINSEIKATGGYTVSFWWKALEGTSWDSINSGQMLAYSSFVPPRVLFALDFYGNGEKINYWLEAYDTCNLSLENLNNIDGGETFEVGNWYFVAVVVGSPITSGGRSLFVMSGSQPGTMVTMKKSWCSYMPEPQEFVQGFTVPGGLLMSPIQVTGRPLTVKELQREFYREKPLYRLRRGPAVLDEDRSANCFSKVKKSSTH